MDSMIYQLFPWIVSSLAFAVFLHSAIKLISSYRKYKKLTAGFDGPKPHWLFGHMADVAKNNLYQGLQWTKKYGPAYIVQLGPAYKQIILTEPEYIRCLLATAEPKDINYSVLAPWLGDGLLLSKGRKWGRNRKLLTPAFHFDILKPYQKIFSESAMIMIEKWKQTCTTNRSQSVEMFHSVSLMTLDSLMKCIFGMDENFQNDNGIQNPYIKTVYELSTLTVRRFRNPFLLNDMIFKLSYSGYCFRKSISTAHQYSAKVIKEKRKEKEVQTNTDNKINRKYLDFLDILLDCRDEEGKGLTEKEIQDEVDTFMFEGHDTTASGLSWCLYNLATHPEYQDKCRDEVMSVLSSDSNAVEWEDLSKLPYLTMCIKESLRLHPPVTTIGRCLTKPLTLPDKRVIPSETSVVVAINTCHRNPKVWPNPEIYNPERFNVENSAKRHSYAFISFSAGPRNCIGQHFAMNEMKTVMALILKNFRLYVDGSMNVERLPELILRSKGGIWLYLEPL